MRTIGEDQPVALTLLAPAEAFPDPDQPPVEMLERTLQGTHHHLRTLLRDPRVNLAREPFADVAEFWFAEKLVLLGGACHAHPGFPELTPSAALEDAWILSRMMERWEESPHEGFAEYERFRKPRARRLRAFAEAERATLTERSPTAAWQRNLKWSLGSRFLPEIAMQRTDWLYGYDCIKGFV
jgi:2-polyprenyl-6-methoxyphenol hydroxylase-like FAD-dependent oxidoreductase